MCSPRAAHDAFFGQGFVHADDRLGQLEYDRRRAYGRWAEVAGPSAVAFDVFTRRCGLRDAATREYDALDPAGRAVLDAFAEGVNAYLALDRPRPTDLASGRRDSGAVVALGLQRGVPRAPRGVRELAEEAVALARRADHGRRRGSRRSSATTIPCPSWCRRATSARRIASTPTTA